MVVWVQFGSGTLNPEQKLRISSSKKQHCEIRNLNYHENFAFMSNSNTSCICHQSPSSLITLAQYVQYFLKQKDYEAHCHVHKIFAWYFNRSVLFTTTQVNDMTCHLVVLLGNQLAMQR
jgi:hypothetical protein